MDAYRNYWNGIAFKASSKAVKRKRKPFTIEELRLSIELEAPPLDDRWWGWATKALKAAGLIKPKLNAEGQQEFKPARSSNHSPKPVWVKA